MPRPIHRLRWYIGGLLFLSTVINYIDRQTLSVLAPVLKTEFQWTNSDFALVVIAFRVAYSIGQTVSGRWLDRVGTRTGLSLAVAFYSVAAMLGSLGNGLRSFMGLRFLLGLGESANWPGATKAVAEWFPRRESGWAVALFDSGSSVGAALAPFIVLWVYQVTGSWRPAFIVTGVLGLLWIPLFRWFYRSPEDHPRLSPRNAQDILANRASPATPRWAARGRVRAQLRHAAAAAADVGDPDRQGPDRPGLVLHHRLVRDLPRDPRLPARGQPARVLGPLHGRGPRQLRRRRVVELPDQARLAGRSRAEDRDRARHAGHALPDSGDLHHVDRGRSPPASPSRPSRTPRCRR